MCAAKPHCVVLCVCASAVRECPWLAAIGGGASRPAAAAERSRRSGAPDDGARGRNVVWFSPLPSASQRHCTSPGRSRSWITTCACLGSLSLAYSGRLVQKGVGKVQCISFPLFDVFCNPIALDIGERAQYEVCLVISVFQSSQMSSSASRWEVVSEQCALHAGTRDDGARHRHVADVSRPGATGGAGLFVCDPAVGALSLGASACAEQICAPQRCWLIVDLNHWVTTMADR